MAPGPAHARSASAECCLAARGGGAGKRGGASGCGWVLGRSFGLGRGRREVGGDGGLGAAVQRGRPRVLRERASRRPLTALGSSPAPPHPCTLHPGCCAAREVTPAPRGAVLPMGHTCHCRRVTPAPRPPHPRVLRPSPRAPRSVQPVFPLPRAGPAEHTRLFLGRGPCPAVPGAPRHGGGRARRLGVGSIAAGARGAAAAQPGTARHGTARHG